MKNMLRDFEPDQVLGGFATDAGCVAGIDLPRSVSRGLGELYMRRRPGARRGPVCRQNHEREWGWYGRPFGVALRAPKRPSETAKLDRHATG